MPRPTYPTDTDLQAELESAGLYDADWNLDLAGAVSRSVSQWENESDWSPFLSSGEEETRRFTIDGTRSLWLLGGLVAPPSEVIVDSVPLTLDSTYWLEPANALAKGKPITRITFARAIRSRHQGASVTGVWGYCTQVPDDVWSAVLQNAALSLEGPLTPRFTERLVAAQNANAPIKAKESGPLRIEYSVVDGVKSFDLTKTFASWSQSYAKTLADYLYKAP